MGDELSFLHPAQDPSEERTSRAHTKVGRTVRLRRNRRRALVSVPLVAMVAVVAISAASPQGGERDRQEVASGGPDNSADVLLVDPDTRWSEVALSADQGTLWIQVGSLPEGTGHCQQTFDYDVVETSESVTVGFEERDPSPSDGCLQLTPQVFEVKLAETLGGRKLYDGVRRQPYGITQPEKIWVSLPDGWSIRNGDPPVDGPWEQTFSKDGTGWYFVISQEPASEAVPPEGTAVPVMVNNIVGRQYSGPSPLERTAGDTVMTRETIQWVEGDLMLTVWGEMTGFSGPPTFTHHDDLLRIAEGVLLPGER